jgi:proton-translocating NADH-quinone oxidoreductase chain N
MTGSIDWLIPELIIASPLIYLAGRIAQRLNDSYGWRVTGSIAARWMALLALIAAWALLAPGLLSLGEPGGGAIEAPMMQSLGLRFDGLSLLLALVSISLGAMVALFSQSYMSGEPSEEKFYALLVMLVGVIVGLGAARDLFNLWIWFEAMAVSSYFLVAFYRDRAAALEAGLKYLMQSTVGSSLVLMGIATVLASAGTLDLAAIRTTQASVGALRLAGVFLVIGFGVKASLVPLHTWLPDAHSQAPSGISAMLSGIVIEAGLIAMLRSVGPLSGSAFPWSKLLLGFAVLNMLLGNFLALRQRQVKRLLAYSSIAQLGYMLLGLGIGLDTGDAAGVQGGLFHLINHGLMKGLAFLAAGGLLYCLHLALGDHGPLTIDDLSGGARRYPVASFSLSIALLGLAGLPPMAGFMSKWQIFIAGMRASSLTLHWLIIFAALNSVFSLAYYTPMINALYKRQPSALVASGRRMPLGMEIPIAALAIAILVLGVWPGLATNMTQAAGRAVMASFGL